MKILIAGGTGFIGKQLCQEFLSAGHQVAVLSRNPSQAQGTLPENVEVIGWNNSEGVIPDKALQGIECIVNLAGESIGDGRWTKAKKESILGSRIKTTQAIVEAIENQGIKPKILISASAIGFYGPCQDEKLTESAPAGQDFLAAVCRAWEYEAYRAERLGVRVATVRIGVVLGDGGALERMMLPFKFYIGGPTGSGNQWFSWIHVKDLVKAIRFVAENASINGPVNATAPQPLRMGDFCDVLGKVMGRPSWLPVPGFVLRLALGEMADMVLNGQRVIPRKLLETGYKFHYSNAKDALDAIIK